MRINGHQKSKWDEESIKKAMFSGNQKNVKLDEVLPIHLAYLTAWMDEDNQLQLRNDVYGLDKVYQNNICE